MALDPKIWNSYGNWEEIAASEDLRHVRRRITGLKSDVWVPNHVPPGLRALLPQIQARCEEIAGHRGTALDFGCGLGRNAPLLGETFGRVLGVDLPDMVAKLRGQPAAAAYDGIFTSVAEAASSGPVHVLFDSVVLQHIVDRAFNKQLLADLLTLSQLEWVISLNYSNGIAPAVRSLLAAGWTSVLSEPDLETFPGKPHTLTVVRRVAAG